jgi:hypothetical protein
MAPLALLLSIIFPVALGLHCGHDARDSPYQRKTINFGPAHASSPAVYATSNPSDQLTSFNALSPGLRKAHNRRFSTPSEAAESIAKAFVRASYATKSFRIADTVANEGLGIVHVHFVEVRKGRDVIDSLVNVNVDPVTGQVIGYGASVLDRPSCDADYSLSDRLQTVFRSNPESDACVYDHPEEAPIDPRLPLLHLLPVVIPQHQLASIESLDDVFDSITHAPSFSPSSDHAFVFGNVPGAEPTHPVTARLAYVQSPTTPTGYESVWSYEFQTLNAEQWYEAHVSASKEAKIHMLVDWVRDFRDPGQTPMPQPQPPKSPKQKKPEAPEVPRGPPKYRVFEWGVNDPTEAKRVYVQKVHDETASPYGWHQVPALNTGRARMELLKEGWEDDEDWLERLEKGHAADFWDTRGSNVIAQENWSGGPYPLASTCPAGLCSKPWQVPRSK